MCCWQEPTESSQLVTVQVSLQKAAPGAGVCQSRTPGHHLPTCERIAQEPLGTLSLTKHEVAEVTHPHEPQWLLAGHPLEVKARLPHPL